MNWINKKLQINNGSYGVLSINAYVNDQHYPPEFNMTIYSYTQCGGNHEHNNFTLKTKDAFRFAQALYSFKTPKEGMKAFKQEYSGRGEMHIEKENTKMLLNIGGGFASSCVGGTVKLSKSQSKKLAGYIMFWLGQYLIGQKKVIKPKRIEKVLDIQDKD